MDRKTDGSEMPCIAVVDDELVNRRLMTEILRLHGFRFKAFSSGEQALEWIECNLQGFDLLVTDVRMPGMNGKELAEKVRAIKPEALILFVTGYSDFTSMELTNGFEATMQILQKPFGSGDLIRKIKALFPIS